MDLKHLAAFAALGALLFLAAAFTGWEPENKRFTEAKTVVLMREIGHRLLLQSGDSTSRVLPVRQLADKEYQLRFGNRLSFIPDSLVSIIQRVIATGDLPENYIVNVLDCGTNEVVFGYAMFTKEEKQVVPCIGRAQVKSCYYINISFQKPVVVPQKSKWIIALALLGLLSILLLLNKRKKRPATMTDNYLSQPAGGFSIGNYFLYEGELKLGQETIPLSVKEAKLLSIFAASPNQIIDRSRLQKEGWEDEGVIVGRSLDVFISKLRKKLEKDPAVKLVNIHGKGYKLEIIVG